VALLGATPLLAQTSPPSPAPVQRAEKAQSDVREVSAKLAAIELPMSVEPSFHFRP
jgi:hypothetical protein